MYLLPNLYQNLIMTRFEKVRFYLFVNSYSGKTIYKYLREKCKSKKLEKSINRLSQVLSFNHKQIDKFIMQRIESKCPYKRIPLILKIYLEIENELMKLSEEKIDEYSTAKEDYHNQLLSPAFERAAGNSLTNISNDLKFQVLLEKNFRSFCYTYYKVVDKYKLPTMRTIPFLLRIIS